MHKNFQRAKLYIIQKKQQQQQQKSIQGNNL